MNGNKILIDTNIISALIKGEDSIAKKIEATRTIYILVIVLGELYYGALHSRQIQFNISVIKKFTSRYKLLLLDEETSMEYGKIKSKLKEQGTPIPENDIWIASIATRHNLILATRDKHFNQIKNLKIINW